VIATEERFLTRHGLAARRLALFLLGHPERQRLPRVRDLSVRLGVGNGTVQAAFGLLAEAGAIETTARGHLGTVLERADRAALWRLGGLGTLFAAMPLPYSRRYEGLATGLRGAFEEAGAPFAVMFVRGAADRVAALVEGKADVAVVSRLAADELAAQHPVELLADLGPATYVGAHGLLVRRGADPLRPGLRVAVDGSSPDQRILARRLFAGRPVVWVDVPYMQLPGLFARGEVDATVWNLDEAASRLGEGVEAVPLDGTEPPWAAGARDPDGRNSRAALLIRTGHPSRALAAVRERLDLGTVTRYQDEVLRGDRTPAY
jgi:YhfZ C-terminal domain/Helix-turn-helix domain